MSPVLLSACYERKTKNGWFLKYAKEQGAKGWCIFFYNIGGIISYDYTATVNDSNMVLPPISWIKVSLIMVRRDIVEWPTDGIIR